MALPVVVASNAVNIARALGTSVTALRARLKDRAAWATLAAGAATVGLAHEEIMEVFTSLSADDGHTATHEDGFIAESADAATNYIQLRASLLDDFAVIDSAVVAAGGLDRFRALRRALALPDETVQAWAFERRRG